MAAIWLLFVLIAYVLGAVPFGLLLGWTRGVDVREHGSGNIGATNVKRVLGKPLGYLCLVLDILKGLAPTAAAAIWLVGPEPGAALLLKWLAIGAAAVLGHTFSVFLRFKGGKGVATTIGMALGIYPYFTIGIGVALAAYAAARIITGYVSAGSISLAAAFPLAVYGYTRWAGMAMVDAWPLPAASAALSLLIIVRHRENIARMLSGKEARVRDWKRDGGAARDA